MATQITTGPPKAPEPILGAPIQVSSAPAATEGLTQEKKRQRFAELRARMGKAMTETTPPAGKAGYWARKDDASEMGRLEYLGFTIVHDDPKHPAWKANGAKVDGTYIIGDVILMEIDAELYQFLLDENVDRGRQMIEGVSDSFKANSAQHGVPTFDVSKSKRG
jgi:hypothetical protein